MSEWMIEPERARISNYRRFKDMLVIFLWCLSAPGIVSRI
ncbi:hypothetical protein HMPREF1502_0232 [Klebsiella sp. AS10]|nr:hypothetical protein HMPREF1502_0232 [Klebsiella sp. AS10]